MCGIGGWVDFGGRTSLEMKAIGMSMVAAMNHRGPDGFGVEVFGGEEDSIAMIMHRRLSILGLGEQGKQPMCSSDGRYWITFNGELFRACVRIWINYKYGYRYRSATSVMEFKGG